MGERGGGGEGRWGRRGVGEMGGGGDGRWGGGEVSSPYLPLPSLPPPLSLFPLPHLPTPLFSPLKIHQNQLIKVSVNVS